jgi:hypothetical protein
MISPHGACPGTFSRHLQLLTVAGVICLPLQLLLMLIAAIHISANTY